MVSNRSNGTSFEYLMACVLRKYGFWVHLLTQSSVGQPADMLAIRGRYHALIDCKLVSVGKTFRFSRIEPNQMTAMRMFGDLAMEPGWFMIRWADGEISMLPHDTAMSLMADGKKSIHYDERLYYGTSLDDWLRRARDAG